VLDQEIVDIQDLDGVGHVAAGKLREAGYDSILAIAKVTSRSANGNWGYNAAIENHQHS